MYWPLSSVLVVFQRKKNKPDDFIRNHQAVHMCLPIHFRLLNDNKYHGFC